MRRRKGIFKGVVLYILRSTPLSGYDILKELSRATHGRYVPSPGTLYPLLSYLEAEGLVESREIYVGRRRKKVYAITPLGEELLNKLMEDGEFREIIEELEKAPQPQMDLLAAIRDELLHIEEALDEVEITDEAKAREVLTILDRIRSKIAAKIK